MPEPNSGCWLWVGTTVTGYGQLTFGRKRWLAHRLAWEAFRGAVPGDLCVLHRCDVPACVNPDHLWTGTRLDNNRDMTAKGRHYQQHKTHCPKGHPYELSRAGSRRCKPCDRARYSAAAYRSVDAADYEDVTPGIPSEPGNAEQMELNGD